MPKHNETEDQLVIRAQKALSSCNWEIGECASRWTERFARGRTDVDFGVLIGLSGDQVYQRRRVWETFADVRDQYPNLKWSHFYVSINWDDASECLQWANENESTVAEMKAWRRALHGEDLSAPANEEPPFSLDPEYITPAAGMVRDPEEFGRDRAGARSAGVPGGDYESAATVASAAREVGESDYAPFGKGARGPAPGEPAASKAAQTTEQILRQATKNLEKALVALTPEVLEEFSSLPIPVQQKFLDTVEQLQSRVAGLE